MNKRSATYTALIELIIKTEREATENNIYSTEIKNGIIERLRLQYKTKRLAQPIVITHLDLVNMCTSAEWYLVGIICSQLKEYNALWLCNEDIKKNSTHRKSIKSLIANRILIKTETVNIYIVNPLHIRRGEFYTVLSTTAKLLENASRVTSIHYVNKKPTDKLDYDSIAREFAVEDNKQIGYGYTQELD